MSYTLKTVADRVCVIVKGINAPFVANVRVRVELNTINNWISQCSIRMFLIYLSPKRH